MKIKTPFILLLFTTSVLLMLPGCFTFGVKPIKIEPIKIDITIKVQVEKDLEEFFEDIDTQA